MRREELVKIVLLVSHLSRDIEREGEGQEHAVQETDPIV